MTMNHKKGWAAMMCIATGVQLGLCASAGAAKKEYSYTGMNGESHRIEAYFPDNHEPGGNAPCFVYFHGGSWVGGDLRAGSVICNYLASRGMVALTANYSMHPKEELDNLPEGESKKRICVMDGKTVIRWAKQHANELGIDPEKVVTGGGSAGGHISVLQMMDEEFNNPADPEAINTEVKAFALFCPAFTVLKKDRCPDVNIFNHLDKKFPPTLFFLGETDNWKKAADALIEKLAEKKSDLEVWKGPEVGHMFFREKEWITSTLITLDEFLVANGFLDGKTPLQPAENDRQPKCIMNSNREEN